MKESVSYYIDILYYHFKRYVTDFIFNNIYFQLKSGESYVVLIQSILN